MGTVYRPLVSVVVPTSGRPQSLQRAIESVCRQTYSNIEILVVNDNILGSSTDISTRECLERMSHASSRRIRMISTSGALGGGAARNVGCAAAKGEYLAFLDDDDVYVSDKIETQVRFTVENDLDMSWQDIAWFDQTGRMVEHRRLDHCKSYDKEGLLRAHLLKPISPTAIYMLKRELFERTAGFGEVKTGQDWWLMLRCIESGARIGYMPGVHVRQFLHEGRRLSLGQNKIDGEMARHAKVQCYYPMLGRKDIRYIEFRHNAVLAVSCHRSGRSLEAIRFGVLAIAASPVSAARELLGFIRADKVQMGTV